jgi:nucleoside-diphosphate-sugar epimerase
MIIAITGGSGFIGKMLTLRHLDHGDTVRLLLRAPEKDITSIKGIDYHFGDITGDIKELVKFVDGVDILYHCAGENKQIEEMQNINVFGTKNLCTAADRKVGHFVQLSSVGVYGPHKDTIITEDTPLNPINEYEKSKFLAEKVVMAFSKQGAFTYSILRPSKVFGSTMVNQILFQLINIINKGFFFFIGQPGSMVNYVHVENVIHALMLCAKKNNAKNKIFNISDYLPIEEFVSVISQALKKSPPRLRLPEFPVRLASRILEKLPNFPLTEMRINALVNKSIYTYEFIQNELGYKHVLNMEEGLKEMISYLNFGE